MDHRLLDPALDWGRVRSWAYWLDNPRLDELARSSADLVVVDYSVDGTAKGELSASQIERVRRTLPARRVVAYVSIGEAESYRYYWRSDWRPGSPSWLLREDRDWPGNFAVRYWDSEWQALVYDYLDRVVAQGFDGVYLDRVDAADEPYAHDHERDMVEFVLAVGEYARGHSSLGDDFGLFVQNAEELWVTYPHSLLALTGIGREEVYVRATDRPTSASERRRVEDKLDRIQASSRANLVLTVDYARDPSLTAEATRRSRSKGYVPLITDVALDRLGDLSGSE